MVFNVPGLMAVEILIPDIKIIEQHIIGEWIIKWKLLPSSLKFYMYLWEMLPLRRKGKSLLNSHIPKLTMQEGLANINWLYIA